MNALATAANTAWWASNLPAWAAFRAALHRPATVQEGLLRQFVRESTNTAFGRAHRFDRIDLYEDYVRHVPLRTYEEFEPFIERIRTGESRVLTADPVTRLATTSGTSSARKLIPYTARLQLAFNRAVGPWIVDLFHSDPALMLGRAYWSVSPVVREPAGSEAGLGPSRFAAGAQLRALSSPKGKRAELRSCGETRDGLTSRLQSKVPIGFEDDSEYLGGIRRWLVEAVMAIPASVRHAPSTDEWRRLTIEHLSRCPDLRLISIWHPSFLTLLVEEMSVSPAKVWPDLKHISCWGDAQAELPLTDLRERFPDVVVQRKGLIATEAMVSIPFAGRWPLAIRSHVFEFLYDDGSVRRPHELRVGDECEVIVTNGGGLFRYRLGDRVIVDGRVGRTPSIRFLGRAGRVSDRFGEKLSEPFVAAALSRVREALSLRWTFAMLAPEGDRYVLYVEGDRYVLYVEGDVHRELAAQLDATLRSNPHYDYCRELGQLKAPDVVVVRDGAQAYLAAEVATGRKLGDVKPAALSVKSGWDGVFSKG